MSAKNQKYNKQTNNKKTTNSRQPSAVSPKKPSAISHRLSAISLLTGILIVVFWCFHYSLHNQFLNWDDGVYIFKNQFIKSFSSYNLKMMLFHGITPSNYHPFAMLSLALNYHFSHLAPRMYYLTNILIHLSNVVLVFLLATELCKKIPSHKPIANSHKLLIASFCALWFGIHPMHVESVSWISERKDVLYTFFYFSGLLCYLKYLEKAISQQPIANSLKWYSLTLLMFFASCLSKPMAVSFPLILFTFDFLLGRKWESPSPHKWGILTEKIPFFLISAFFGVLAFYIQKNSGAVADFHSISIIDRILFAFYGFTMYLIKLVLPIHLNAFYPYPDFRPSVSLPAIFHIMPIFAILIAAIPFYFKWKKKENLYKITLFGLGFYFLNIVFVLQFVSCGDAIIADRYSYVSYFGLIFMIFYLANELITSLPAFKIPVVVIIAGISLWFAVLCEARTKVWHNPETFWTDVIAKSDMHSQLPYLDLGDYYADSGKYDKAYIEYAILAKLHSDQAYIYSRLGNYYGMHNKFDSSLYFFSKALKLDSNAYNTYLNRAVTYSIMGKLQPALKDYNKAFSLDSTDDGLVVKRAFAFTQLGQYMDAIKDYNRLIRREPKEPSNYMYRGNAYQNKGDYPMAEKDYLQVVTLQPNNGECMYYLSEVFNKLSDKTDALKYALMAKRNKYQVSADYINRLQ